jgi:hypothetical protein
LPEEIDELDYQKCFALDKYLVVAVLDLLGGINEEFPHL